MNQDNNFNNWENNTTFNNNTPNVNNSLNNTNSQNLNQTVYSQTYMQPNPDNFQDDSSNKNNKKRAKVFIIIAILLVVAILIVILIFNLFFNKKTYEPVVVSSTFEKVGSYYVLKDENGKVLLENISSHGEFCNGTTEVKNSNGEYAIINGSGKFVVNYGKYDYIDQYSASGGEYHCFYKVDDNTTFQSSILKYDGSILYSNSDDKYLNNVKLTLYYSSNKFVMFTTPEKYEVLNYLGNTIVSFPKDENIDAPIIIENDTSEADDKYIAIYYNGKTYLYNLNTFREVIKPLDGKFQIKSMHTIKSTIELNIAGIKNESTKEEDSLILFGYINENDDLTTTYVIDKNKITFTTNSCLNVTFLNGEVRCLIENGGVFEYYDVNGNKLNK